MSLTEIPRNMIGIATLQGLDIGKRVNAFYFSLLISALTWFTASLIQNQAYSRWKSLLPEQKPINTISVFGIMVIFSALFISGAPETLNTILALFVLAFVHSVFPETGKKKLKSIDLIQVILCAASLSILIREVLWIYFDYSGNFYFNDILLYTGIPLILIKWIISEKLKWNTKFFRGLTYLFTWIPITSVINRELTMIAATRGIEGLSLQVTFFPVMFIVFLIAIWRYYASHQTRKFPAQVSVQAAVFAMGFLFSAFYTPVTVWKNEMFELANGALGIQRLFFYGEIPILESFNSHLLFELSTGVIYSLLNGFQGIEFTVYDYLHAVLGGVATFYFFSRWWKDRFLALAFLVFYPFLILLLPGSFEIILFMPLLLEYWNRKQNLKSYLGVLFALLCMILWKIDFGFSAVFSVFILWGILHFTGQSTINIRKVLISSLVILLAAALVVLYSYIESIPLWGNYLQALHYLRSQQTYGMVDLAGEYNSTFYAQYFVFPLLIWSLLIYIIFNLSNLVQRTGFFKVAAYLFIVLFYLVNFHRGLIRHGFIESNDKWISSFAFFILPASIYFFRMGSRWLPYKNLLFIGLSFFFLLAFKFPDMKAPWYNFQEFNNRYSKVDSTWKNGEASSPRIIDSAGVKEKRLEGIERFFNNYTSDSETFYDYSNNPMLYFYLEKRPPSYFNQMLLSMHDDFLHQTVIDTLEKGKIPFIIYSSFPESGFDNLDGVPKNLRHYPLAEYIHRNYQPFSMVDEFVIWKQKDNKAHINAINVVPKTDTLQDALKLTFKESLRYDNLELSIMAREYFEVVAGDSIIYPDYFARGKSYFRFRKEDLSSEWIKIKGPLDSIKQLEISNVEFYKDHYSYRNRHHDLYHLPEIWANSYDKNDFFAIPLHRVIRDSVPGFAYRIPDDLDKSQGNFLLIEGSTAWDQHTGCSVYLETQKEVVGSFSFLMSEDKRMDNYLIRVSAQYLWNREDIEEIVIMPEYYLTEIQNVYILNSKE